jgi:hypothetical protein
VFTGNFPIDVSIHVLRPWNPLQRAINTARAIKKVVCSFVPDGSAQGLSGSFGAAGGEFIGSVEIVTNYNTGEVSTFGAHGYQLGMTSMASAQVQMTAIYDLGYANSNYSGGFSHFSASAFFASVGGAVASGGTAHPTDIKWSGTHTATVGLGKGVNIWPTAVAGATDTSQPINNGNIFLNRNQHPNAAQEILVAANYYCKR